MNSIEDSNKRPELFSALHITLNQLITEFKEITEDRKKLLNELAQFIQNKVNANQKVYLNFICTHNSRRSHVAQIWAQTAAYYYRIHGVECLSGGTEATAFNPRAVNALQDAGFDIRKMEEGNNPKYEVRFSNDASPIVSFSKKYDDSFNHSNDFAAIMTCSHADQNCPLVLGASTRIAITYDDPKDFDGTPLEGNKYKERVRQIGKEMLFAFSLVKEMNSF